MLDRYRKKKAKKKLAEALKGEAIPSFRQGTLKLLQILRQEDTTLEQVGEAVHWDPGLFLRVLQVVNSAAFGLARRVDDVRHAVHMMGRSKLEQLVLAMAVQDSLPMPPTSGFDPGRFWEAAFFRATASRNIAQELHPADAERSFTAGLLQDMAVPLLVRARPEAYGEILEAWHGSSEARLFELEREALGWSHDELGEHLAVEWNLPPELVEAIGLHHSPDAPDESLSPALKLVALHQEKELDDSQQAIIESGRSDYGLAPDWMVDTLRVSREQALELVGALDLPRRKAS